MQMIGIIFALFLFPMVIIFSSLLLRRGIKTDESVKVREPYVLLDMISTTLFGIPGLLLFSLFPILAFNFGISATWISFGYSAGLITSFLLMKKTAGSESDLISTFGLTHSNVRGNLLVERLIYLISFLLVSFMVSSQVFAILLPLSSYSLIVPFSLLVPLVVILVNQAARRIFSILSMIAISLIFIFITFFLLFKIGGLSVLLDRLFRSDYELINVMNHDVYFFSGGFFFGFAVMGHPQIISIASRIRDRTGFITGGIVSVCVSTMILWSAFYLGLIHKTFNPNVELFDPAKLSDFYRFSSRHLDSAIVLSLMCVGIVLTFIMFLTRQISFLVDLTRQSGINRDKKYGFLIFTLIIILVILFFIYKNHLMDITFSWILTGCVFGPLFLVSRFRRLNPNEVLLSMIIALIVTCSFYSARILGIRLWGYPMIHEVIPGFLSGLIFLLISGFVSGHAKSPDHKQKSDSQ
jgi:hypothetical protein